MENAINNLAARTPTSAIKARNPINLPKSRRAKINRKKATCKMRQREKGRKRERGREANTGRNSIEPKRVKRKKGRGKITNKTHAGVPPVGMGYARHSDDLQQKTLKLIYSSFLIYFAMLNNRKIFKYFLFCG